jgi:hypothetical protein
MQKMRVALLLLLVAISGCTYTINYTIVWFEPNAVGENAKVDLSMDSQFSTSKTISPATELSLPLLKEMEKNIKELKERELNKKKE